MPTFSYPSNLPGLQNEGSAIRNAQTLLSNLFTMSGNPLGPMSQQGIVAAACAEALSGIGTTQQIDVRQFGQWQDGVNCTSTIIAALTAAGTNTVGGTPYPLGIVMPTLPDPLGGVLLSAAINAGPIQIPTGVSLVGSGWKTHLTVDPATVTTANTNYHIFDTIGTVGQNVIGNFQCDGNKANIGNIGNSGFQAFYIPNTCSDILFYNLFVHDIPNGTGESFGILAGGNRILVMNSTFYNIVGTGINFSGPNPTPPQGSADRGAIGCVAYNNTWQGFSTFQTQYTFFEGCHAYGNTQRGFDTEWSDNIRFVNCHARGNGYQGFGGFGGNSNILISGCSSVGNCNGTEAQDGEIAFYPGTDGTNVAMAKSCWVIGCNVQPLPGGYGHIAVGDRASGNSAGNPSAMTADDAQVGVGFYVMGPDVEKWNYNVPNTPFNNKYAPCGLIIRTGASGGAAPSQGGHPSTWTLVNTTVSAAPSGALSTNTAKTFTQTAANSTSSAISVAAFMLKGCRYRVHYRIKTIDANATWEVSLNGQIKQVQIPHTTTDLGVWFEGEFIVTIPPSFANNFLQVLTVANTASASAVGVDYITTELLPYLGGLSGS